MKKVYFIFVSVFLFLSVSFAQSSTETAISMVQEAVDFANVNGKDAVIQEINKPDGKFVKNDNYIFAYDLNAVIVAHPFNPGIVGKNLLEVPDADGELYRKDILAMAKKDGVGWVDFKYKNPKTSEIEDKSTYFKKIGDLIICCGVYKNK